MSTALQPRTIRKSLSLTLITIGAFMILVSVIAMMKKDAEAYRVIPGAAVLVMLGSVLYLRRANEEKKIEGTSQR